MITLDTGVSLNYRVWEGDGPPLVLAHGLASSMRIWDLVVPLLTEKFTVVTYDQRGHSLSDKPDEGYDLATMVADLHELIGALKLDMPVVVGHSWGATSALGYAAAHPDECAGIALVDGGVMNFGDMPGATWETISKELAPPDLSRFTLNDMLERMKHGRPMLSHMSDAQTSQFFQSLMEEQPDGTIRPRLTRERHMRILRTIYDTHPGELFGKIKCPVLIVLAERPPDEDVERRATEPDVRKRRINRARESLGSVKVVLLENSAHDVPLHRPERLAREMIDFFAG